MLIKQADDKTPLINQLDALLERNDLTEFQRKQIEQEKRSVLSGVKGEKDAAYQIDFDYGSGKNWMVIHDLRVEDKDGWFAQIDHLLINRFLEFYVCESKSFCEGITITEHGEFLSYFNHKPHGIPSPIEQNKRHISVLESVINSPAITLPRRMGMTISPTFKSVILISNNARIDRPEKSIEGEESIIKAEQITSHITKRVDAALKSPLNMAKIVSSETIEAIARQLVSLHKEANFDVSAKFGIKPAPEPKKEEPATTPPTAPEEPVGKGQKLICAKCGAKISFPVAKFCWSNPKRFDGKAYCMDCQKGISITSSERSQ